MAHELQQREDFEYAIGRARDVLDNRKNLDLHSSIFATLKLNITDPDVKDLLLRLAMQTEGVSMSNGNAAAQIIASDPDLNPEARTLLQAKLPHSSSQIHAVKELVQRVQSNDLDAYSMLEKVMMAPDAAPIVKAQVMIHLGQQEEFSDLKFQMFRLGLALNHNYGEISGKDGIVSITAVEALRQFLWHEDVWSEIIDIAKNPARPENLRLASIKALSGFRDLKTDEETVKSLNRKLSELADELLTDRNPVIAIRARQLKQSASNK